MANHILAVELGPESVALAIAQSTLRSLRVQLLAVLDPASSALPDLLRSHEWDRVIASVPGEGAAFRLLDFPFRDRRRLQQAVGPALEAHVPLSLDDCDVAWDFTAADHRGPVLGAMFPREALERHRSALSVLGIHPHRMVWKPSATLELYRRAATEHTFTAIDLGADCATVACFVEGRLHGLRVTARADDEVMVRNVGWFVRTLEPPNGRCVVGGARADVLLPALAAAVSGLEITLLPERCPIDIVPGAAPAWQKSTGVLGLVLAARGDTAPPLLEVAQAAPPAVAVERREMLRSLGPWVGATAGLLLLAGALDVARLARRERQLDAVATRIYSAVMPGSAGGSGQRIKMEARVTELERRLGQASGTAPSSSPLGVLADMSAAVPADLEVEFDLYAYDPPAVRLRGHAQNFESVTRLQDLLRGSGRFAGVEVSDVHAAVNEGVEFELSLKVQGGEQPT